MSADHIRQAMIEVAQAADAYHSARVAELNAEIKRLRTNITHLQTYAEGRAVKYEAAANGPIIGRYFRGKAEAYADMARMTCVAYCADFNTTEDGAKDDAK